MGGTCRENFSTFHTQSSLFLDVTRRRLVNGYQRFGRTYRSHLQGSVCPPAYTAFIPEERRILVRRVGILKSRIGLRFILWTATWNVIHCCLSTATLLIFIACFASKVIQAKWLEWYVRCEQNCERSTLLRCMYVVHCLSCSQQSSPSYKASLNNPPVNCLAPKKSWQNG